MRNILYVASESVPFIKTGGLADVVGALPKEFNRESFDVRVVLPLYSCIPWKYREHFEYLDHFYVNAGPYIQEKYVGIFIYKYDAITYYFIDNLEYFTCDYPYGEIKRDIERFTFFNMAVLSILPVIDFKPDLIHCHDWQSAWIPVYIKTIFSENPFYQNIKTMMTIHNLKFQGRWGKDFLQGVTGFDDSMFSQDKLEFYKDGSMLKGGLVYADYITTVSEAYAKEIQSPFFGEGLDGLLYARHMSLKGIVNGIDTDIFNPKIDSTITKNYDVNNFRTNKIKNKIALQRELGLEEDKKKFMIGIVSRLTDQKGLDLLDYAMKSIIDEVTQLVVIGTGDEKYEEMLKYYQKKYPNQVVAIISYKDALAHRVYASSDVYLMPSKFEPCGLSQLISLRYGTIPIVRETGGLADTVEPYNEYEHTGTGFSFANYNGDELVHIVNYAKHIFFDKKREWNKIIERGMEQDYSWAKSTEEYAKLYHYLVG